MALVCAFLLLPQGKTLCHPCVHLRRHRHERPLISVKRLVKNVITQLSTIFSALFMVTAALVHIRSAYRAKLLSHGAAHRNFFLYSALDLAYKVAVRSSSHHVSLCHKPAVDLSVCRSFLRQSFHPSVEYSGRLL